MPDSFTYPKPNNETDWETLCCRVFAKLLGVGPFQKFKRRGQVQHGVDLIAPDGDKGAAVIQCKLRNSGKGLKREDAEADVDAAKRLVDDKTGNSVRISRFVIATTDGVNDHTAWAANVTAAHRAEGSFDVRVYTWPDFETVLNNNPDLKTWYLGTLAPKPSLHNLPALVSRYVDRPTELERVHAILSAPTHKGAALQAGYSGHGGQGKSTLALAYAWKCRDESHPWFNSYPGGTYFISCGAGAQANETPSILAQVAALAPFCGAKIEDDERQTAANVKCTLENGRPCLIILDNVTDSARWQGDEFGSLLPQVNCRFLLTTRAKGLAGVDEVPVGYLSPPQALELLGKYKPIVANDGENKAAEQIAAWLGGLAVAVAAVGSTLKRTPRSTYAAYWTVLQKKKVRELPGGDPKTAKEIMYQHRAAVVIDDAYDALDKPARRAVKYASLMPEDMVPLPWLVSLLEVDGAAGEIALLAIDGLPTSPAEEVVRRMIDEGTLATRGEDGKILSLHRLWRARINEHALEREEDRSILLAAIATHAAGRDAELVQGRGGLGTGTIDDPAAVADQTLRWELAPLVAVCKTLWDQGQSGRAVRVGAWLAGVLTHLGRYTDAASCLPLSAKTDDTVALALGREGLAACYSMLAMIKQNVGDLSGAKSICERAIAIQKGCLPPDHPSFAVSYNNLALILREGDPINALYFKRQSMEIEQKHLGADHPQIGNSYSNLAVIQHATGDFAGAQASMNRALAITAKNFGSQHPKFALVLTNLSEMHRTAGNLASARECILIATNIIETKLGLDHPHLATTYSILALIQKDEGDIAGARANIEHAIAIEQKHFVSDHPNLASSYNTLAHISYAEGDHAAAASNFDKALTILLRHFNENHPHVKDVRRSLEDAGRGPFLTS